MRQVVLRTGEDGFWIVEVPSLPGCVTQGRTPEEAIENVKDAIEVYESVLREKHLPIPPERFDTRVVCVP